MAISETLKIGIIGFGPFAQFLARTMINQGHTLVATSRSDHSLLCSQLGIPFFKDFGDFFASGSTVIVLCTSILSTADVLSSIPAGDLRKPELFVDVLSVKEHPRDLLLRVLPEEGDLLCTHPMFGPESGGGGWNGLPFVYDRVRVRNGGLCDQYLGIFHREGCRMVEMSCEEHDRMTAKTQFITHTIGRYKVAYNGAISTMPGKRLWAMTVDSVEVGPPNSLRPRGRPKKRIPSFLETTTKSKVMHKCSRCGDLCFEFK